MANPSGVNGYTPAQNEVPYGEAQQNAAVQRSAPLAGQGSTPSPANAPRRAQRRAIRGAPQEEQQGPPPQMPGDMAQVAPQVEVATFWAQVAQVPGASDLVKSIAQEASSGSQNVSAPAPR